MAGVAIAQIDAAITLFTSLLEHGARTSRYKSNLQWLLKLRARALLRISEAPSTHQGDLHQGVDSSQTNNNGDEDGHIEEDEDVELLGWRTRLIERAGQGRKKTIRTIPLAETPTDSLITDIANPPLDENRVQGQLGSFDMAMPAASLPAETFDWTNDIVSQTSTYPGIRLS